jgi:cyclic pyranopterin phosphate synthase
MTPLLLPHLETNVTSACQLRCAHCNHFVALDAAARPKPFMLDPDAFAEDLKNACRVLHVEKFGMLGGEPTLHPNLALLIHRVKTSGIANEIEVWTNGIRIADYVQSKVRNVLTPLWESPFDTLVVSAYPGTLNDAKLHAIGMQCIEYGKRLEVKDERLHPNFTQLLKKEPGRAQETYDACWFRTFSRVLDGGYLYQCCCGPYVPRLLLGLPEGTDGLKIDEDTTTEQVAAYLWQRDALKSCAPCAGRNTSDAVPVKWEEIRDPKLWLERSSGR